MRTLTKVRKDIEKVDKKMKKLFLKRMSYSMEVKEIKDSLNMEYESKDREDYLKRKYAKDLIEFRTEYLEFIDNIFTISKESMKK